VIFPKSDHHDADPQRFLGYAAPLRPLSDAETADIKAIRRDRLGGVIHEYTQVT
jgi:hypothetical protein